MIPHQARDAMADFVTDNDHDPMNILGAAICLMRLHGDVEEKRIAIAVDNAIRAEISEMRMIGRVYGNC